MTLIHETRGMPVDKPVTSAQGLRMASIGLISDVHATPEPVAEALSIFEQRGVDHVFCAGDIAGYRERLEETIALLVEHRCRSVFGNHDLLYLDHFAEDQDKYSACLAARKAEGVGTAKDHDERIADYIWEELGGKSYGSTYSICRAIEEGRLPSQ